MKASYTSIKFEPGSKNREDRRLEVSFVKFNACMNAVCREIPNLFKGGLSVMNTLTEACNIEYLFIKAWSTSLSPAECFQFWRIHSKSLHRWSLWLLSLV